jgi:tRNA modification GTPase
LEGFRFAKGGEFCLRAFQNGRISLNEAEAINKLVLSESVVQHKLAIAEMNGSGRDFFEKIKGYILKILSLLEAYIDFSEEEELSVDFILEIEKISQKVKNLLADALAIAQKKQNCDVQIAIFGKPNVGKSSLFNAIVGEDDAIVSSIAGTTRDIIKKTINLFGFKAEIIDTAGIRTGGDEIEEIGILKAKRIAKKADLVLHLKEFDEDMDFEGFAGQVVNVWTKSDIHGTRQGGVSISTGDISPLMHFLEEVLMEKFQKMKGVGFSCNERQKGIILQAISCLEKIDFQKGLQFGAEILSEEFRHVLQVLSMIIGGIDVEDILGEIFSSFCIGN